MDPRINAEINRINELKAAAAAASDRQHQFDLIEARGKQDRLTEVAKGSGGQSITERRYQDDIALRNFMGKYGISPDEHGAYGSPQFTKEQADVMAADAAQNGLAVYFNEGTVEDVGSKWNPFDNKEVPVFTVRSVVPTGAAATAGSGAASSSTPGSPRVTVQQLESDPKAIEIREQMRRGEITREQAKAALQGKPLQKKTEDGKVEAPAKEEKPIQRGSLTNPPKGMPLDEALGKLSKAVNSPIPGGEQLAREAAILGGFAYEEFIGKPVNTIYRWLKKAYSKEGMDEARKSIQ